MASLIYNYNRTVANQSVAPYPKLTTRPSFALVQVCQLNAGENYLSINVDSSIDGGALATWGVPPSVEVGNG